MSKDLGYGCCKLWVSTSQGAQFRNLGCYYFGMRGFGVNQGLEGRRLCARLGFKPLALLVHCGF